MKAKVIFLLVIVAIIISCNRTTSLNKDELYINNVMAQCQNFDEKTFIQCLPGEWKRDSYIVYSDEWDKDFEALLLNGDSSDSAGLAAMSFTFTVEGTGQICTINYSLGTDNTSIRNFDWRYDAESNNLIVSGESVNTQYYVSGFNGEYLVLDYTEHLYDKHTDKHIYSNIREIFKRKTE